MTIKYRLLFKKKGASTYNYREFYNYNIALGFYFFYNNAIDLFEDTRIIKREVDFKEPLQEKL